MRAWDDARAGSPHHGKMRGLEVRTTGGETWGLFFLDIASVEAADVSVLDEGVLPGSEGGIVFPDVASIAQHLFSFLFFVLVVENSGAGVIVKRGVVPDVKFIFEGDGLLDSVGFECAEQKFELAQAGHSFVFLGETGDEFLEALVGGFPIFRHEVHLGEIELDVGVVG